MKNNWINFIEERGWYKFDKIIDEPFIDNLKSEIFEKENYYAKVQSAGGVFNESKNAFHHTIVSCKRTQIKLFDPFPLFSELYDYFKGNFILNACGSTTIYPKSSVYTQNIHRDSRSFLNDKYMMNFVLLLDDSNEDNGSTWVLEKSHLKSERPSDGLFFDKGIRLNGKAGDVIAFDANLWHSSGKNNSDNTRTIVTFLLTKPFIKPSLNYPEILCDYNNSNYSSELRQILGFNARIPNSIEDFYKPKNLRYYKSDQG